MSGGGSFDSLLALKLALYLEKSFLFNRELLRRFLQRRSSLPLDLSFAYCVQNGCRCLFKNWR